MDILLDTLKGFLVGICASAPMGPIAILVVQKTLSKGQKAGFFTGLGASVVDTIYALIAIFALAFAQSFIHAHENIIYLAGGTILVGIGLSMALSNPFRRRKKAEEKKSNFSSTDFLQAIAMGISNPMAIFVIFALFGFVGITNDDPTSWNVAPIILSVSAGTVCYWLFLSWALSHFRDKFSLRTILWLSRVMGAIVVIIGLVLVGKGLFNVLFLSQPLK
jgi:threonine/homoserine/homoserine lactone efflux protein